jgi:hypothetical protein
VYVIMSDRLKHIKNAGEAAADASIARLNQKADNTNIGLLAATAIDTAQLAIGLALLWYVDGLVFDVIGGVAAFLAVLGLSGKVLRRI